MELGRGILHLSPPSWSARSGEPLVVERGVAQVLFEGWMSLNTPPEVLSRVANAQNTRDGSEAVGVNHPQLQIIFEMQAWDDFSLQQVGSGALTRSVSVNTTNEEMVGETVQT